MLQTILLTLSAAITIAAVIPYLVEIVRGKAKPRIVSWLTWTLLMLVAMSASFAEHHYVAGVLLAASSMENLLVVVLGYKHGDRRFDRVDIICQAGAIAGLFLWLAFNSPAIAVLATMAIDLIGGVPTLVHAWKLPHEETWLTFLLAGLGAGISVCLVDSWQITAIAYPLYILTLNLLVATLILVRHRYVVAAVPVKVRGI